MKYSWLGVLVAIVLALFPFVTTDALFYGAVNAKFLLVILGIDLGLVVAAYYTYRTERVAPSTRPWFLVALLLAFAVHAAAAHLGVYAERSLWSDILRSSGLIYLGHVLALALVLGAWARESDWALVRRTLVLSAGVFALLSTIGAYGLGAEGRFLWLDLSSEALSLGNSTFAGTYLLLALVVAVWEIVRSWNSVRWRIALLISGVFIALSPILLNVRGALEATMDGTFLSNPEVLLGSARASSATMLALLFFACVYALCERFLRGRRQWLAQASVAGALFVGIGVSIGLLFTPGSVVQDAYIESSTGARIVVWEAGIEAFKERPHFGWGPENFNSAFERHFDNRLFQDEYIGEIWFDRAHNVFVDTLVTVGAVGTLSIVLVMFAFAYTVFRARRRDLIGKHEAVLLWALIPAHILQLQTGFDTIGSYLLLGIIAGYALWLERKSAQDTLSIPLDNIARASGAGVLLIAALTSFALVFLAELDRQTALRAIFLTSNTEEQHEYIRTALSRTPDFEALRLSASSFIKGGLGGMATAPDQEAYRQILLSSAELYESYYNAYLEDYPEYYRTRMNLAYLLMIQTALGNNRLEEAHELLQDSYHLSPENPITYGLDATIAVYSRNFQAAADLSDEMLALNPDAPFSQEMYEYIGKQILSFPQVTVLKLENL